MARLNPRRVAFDILLRIEKERSYADILLDKALSRGGLEGPDRGLLTELVYGVMRRRGTLDHVIDQFASQRCDRLEQAVLALLRLGLYQVLYLDRIPVRAAVNETVELAKALTPRASGFINAVLRQADRGRGNISYPDRERDLAGFLAARYSHPIWLVERWIGQLGPDEAEQLAEVMSKPAPVTIRVNTLKGTRENLLGQLAEDGVQGAPTRYSPHGITITSTPVPPARLSSFREGFFTIQDESSQLTSLILAPIPGERLLDLCAAPGGKATHLAQLMEDSGVLTACDVAGRKLPLIAQTAARLGISCITTLALDATRPLAPLGGALFPRILLDAPCSGLGVIRRNPEGKWWKKPSDLDTLALGQRAILRNGADRLSSGGLLVYATCSTSEEENEAVIDDFLSQRPDFMLEDVRGLFPQWRDIMTNRGFFRSWPHRHGMDGFFAARLKKR